MKHPLYCHTSLTVNVTLPRAGTGAILNGQTNTMADARDYAALLLANDPNRLAVEIGYCETCAVCGGSGRVRKAGRVLLAWKPCKACDGRGQIFEIVLETIERD